MPVEIRELVVSVTLDEHTESSAGQGGNLSYEEMRRLLVDECVEAVMTALRDKGEP